MWPNCLTLLFFIKAAVFEEDFRSEREDREKAAGKLDEERAQLEHTVKEMHGYKNSNEQLMRKKAHLEKMLADLQENLAAVETAFQRSQDVSRDLTRKLQDVHRDLEEKTREAERLRNELENSSDKYKAELQREKVMISIYIISE